MLPGSLIDADSRQQNLPFVLFKYFRIVLFPDLPVSRMLRGRNILILGCLALILSVLDAAAPLYWNKYPLAAALLKLVLGGTVVGVLSVRTQKAFGKLKSPAV